MAHDSQLKSKTATETYALWNCVIWVYGHFMYAKIAHMCTQTRLHIYVHTHTHTRQNWIFEEIHQELNPATCKLKLKWQARWVDQTQYPMIAVASLSAVPQSCRTPLLIKRREERKRKKGKFYIYLDVTPTHVYFLHTHIYIYLYMHAYMFL